jgi:hypothetical protein
MILLMTGLRLHLYRFLIAGTASFVTFLSFAFGQQAKVIENHQYEGTLGKSRIGMTVIREGNVIKSGHYFYQQFLQDIPIAGSARNSQVTLTEAGGGTFRLHFRSNGSQGDQLLDFENSVGMNGTWTSGDGSRSYTVSLHGTTISEGEDNGHRYQGVTNESDAAFESRVQSILRAVLRGDKSTTLRFTSFPLRVNFPDRKHKMFRNSEGVISAWNDLFTPALIAKLRTALPHDMFVHEGMAMLGDGEAWFDANGLAVLNIPARAASRNSKPVH